MNKFVVKIYLCLQIFVLACTLLGFKFLPENEGYLGKGLGELVGKPLIYSRANFDGFHYAKIARDGYGYLQQAFFPFYPRLIKFLFPVFKSFILSGIFISNLSFLLALIFLAKLLSLEKVKEEVIKKTIFLLAFFPTSFYFLSAYTESLFLFLVVFSFYLAKRKNWLAAGLIAGLASATRIVGIFILPALLLEYYQQNRLKFEKKINFLDKNILFIALSAWGLIAYCLFLKKTTGDPLYFIHAQPEKIILLYQVFWRYLKMILTVDPTNPIYFNVLLEAGSAILFLTLIVISLFKFKVRSSYLLFFFLAYILPTLTGTFLSLPRMVLVIFPGFWVMGMVTDKYRRLGIIWSLVSIILLTFCTILFTRGYWGA